MLKLAKHSIICEVVLDWGVIVLRRGREPPGVGLRELS
ncbi:hypothetical protein OHAE_757 [Ochrobactrum soli]|uniref:Uncharacterized protein n=1 Tax=Ochrobactrum soli TaxID=2448455 RepID=A0A2P9HM11_9HYPH|nr:hypothetical protein OHAE_757 [[Ochrobactrum] soli]